MGFPQETIQAKQLAQQRELAAAGLTGEFEGDPTLAAEQLSQQQTQFDEAQALRRGEALGEIETVDQMGYPTTRETLAAQQMAQRESQFGRQQELAEAGVTGQYKDQETLAAEIARAQDLRAEEQFRKRDPVTMALAAEQLKEGSSTIDVGRRIRNLVAGYETRPLNPNEVNDPSIVKDDHGDVVLNPDGSIKRKTNIDPRKYRR